MLKYILKSFLALCVLSTNASQECRSGFKNAGDRTCYLVVDDVYKTWDQARTHCQDRQSDLITFEDRQTEEDAINESPVLNHWIGLNDEDIEGHYKWLNDTYNASYTNWGFDQPGQAENLDCVAAGPLENGWFEMWCNTLQPFICGYQVEAAEPTDVPSTVRAQTEVPVDEPTISFVPPEVPVNEPTTLFVPPEVPVNEPTTSFVPPVVPACPAGMTPFGNECVWLVEQRLSWEDARINCQNMGADLLVVPNPETHRKVKALFGDATSVHSKFRYWFGLHQRDGGPVMWLDQVKQSKFSRSFRQMSNITGESDLCGVIIGWKDGRWNNAPCFSEQHKSICMRQQSIDKLLVIDAAQGEPITEVFAFNQLTTSAENNDIETTTVITATETATANQTMNTSEEEE